MYNSVLHINFNRRIAKKIRAYLMYSNMHGICDGSFPLSIRNIFNLCCFQVLFGVDINICSQNNITDPIVIKLSAKLNTGKL